MSITRISLEEEELTFAIEHMSDAYGGVFTTVVPTHTTDVDVDVAVVAVVVSSATDAAVVIAGGVQSSNTDVGVTENTVELLLNSDAFA